MVSLWSPEFRGKVNIRKSYLQRKRPSEEGLDRALMVSDPVKAFKVLMVSDPIRFRFIVGSLKVAKERGQTETVACPLIMIF